MPSENDSQPVSAFSVYKKSPNKPIVKKKKQKRKLRSVKQTITIRKQIKRKRENSEEKVPTLIAVTNEETAIGKTSKIVENGTKKLKIKLKTPKKVKLNNTPKTKKVKVKSLDNPTLEASHLFKWLISPLKPEDFFKKYWEQKALHIQRPNKNYYSHILDSNTLDKILRNHPLYYSRNIDVVSYENGVKEVHNQEGRATSSAVWDYYSNGCSVRILNPQTYNHKVHLLVSTLQEYFGSMVGANVYLTPPGSQGFAPHYDDIEAFVIQLEGRKHWKLYEPKGSDVLARFSSPNLKREDIGAPFMEVTLQAGEVLYFPRGTIHEGSTDEEAHSLHVTVSVYQQNSYADLLGHILPKALEKAAESNVEFRRGLPLNYLKNFGAISSSHDRDTVVKTVASLLESLVTDYIDIDSAADQLGRKLMRDSMPPVLSKSETERTVKLDGPYLKEGQVINRVEIGLDTRVRLLRYYCIRLVHEDDSSLKLYYNTENANVYHGEEEQWLELDESMVPVIKVLQNTYPKYVEVEELPMEDIELKMQLISDLWEHGLLVTEQPLEVIDD